MRLVLHPKVYSDVSTVMEYYARMNTAELADEFYRELKRLMVKAAQSPKSFAIRQG